MAASWLENGEQKWGIPAAQNVLEGEFDPRVPEGRYILALAILDPAGMLPSVRFATANYLSGGRHPIAVIDIGGSSGGPLDVDFRFDDPSTDQTLHYLTP